MTVRKSVAGVSYLSRPVDTLVSLFPIIHQLVSNLEFTDKQVDWKKVYQCQVASPGRLIKIISTDLPLK